MHWFRKARYLVALLVIVFTGVGLATQFGQVPVRALATRYALLVGMLGLLALVFWLDRSFTAWLRE